MVTLSLLIPTLPDRKHFLKELLDNLNKQIEACNAEFEVEILIDDRGKHITTGRKRNNLLDMAQGKYVWQIDDDDYIYDYSIKDILKACEKNPDVIGINGVMTTDGKNPVYWEIRLGHPYKAIKKDGKEYYLRHPNHITPMKREHAIKAKFPDKTVFEDYEWAKIINDAGYLKTQEIIDKQIYWYKCRTKK
jgi:glycosyltransferase involved in cell wall biosynthesis